MNLVFPVTEGARFSVDATFTSSGFANRVSEPASILMLAIPLAGFLLWRCAPVTALVLVLLCGGAPAFAMDWEKGQKALESAQPRHFFTVPPSQGTRSISGCTVLEARDGRSGLDLYRSRRIDCIISELCLPDMSGYELLHEVVPRVGQPEIPIILLASIARMGLADMAKASGAQALLWKHTGNELIPVIRRVIAQVGPTEKDRQQDDQISE
jgi:CheY-like chemotaxis protein